MRRLLVLAALLAVGLPPVLAQMTDPMEVGILAFREGQYEAAAEAFERAIAADDQNAEAHFLLARIYFETPLKNIRKAGRALDKALEIEPDNVQYMVAQLQHLRDESGFFLADKVRETRRLELSRKILKLDDTNAFAHEEMGAAYIRDFWRYRNAFMFPFLEFNAPEYRRRSQTDPIAAIIANQYATFEQQLQLDEGELSEQTTIGVPELLTPDRVFLADQFDVDRLRDQGVPVQDLTSRAQRAYDKAVYHLQQALETDPRHAVAYDHMMRVFALKGEYQNALKMLQQMYVFFPEDDKLWLYLGFTHYRLGNMEAASKSFESAFTYMDEATKNAFTRLDEILPVDEKKRYEEDAVAYASRFWISKDPRYLTPYNERKLEHYARLVYADLLYGAPDLNLRGWDTQRGGILVRYGVPRADIMIIPQSQSRVNQPMGQEIADPTGANSPGGAGSSGATMQQAIGGTSFDIAREANTFNIWDYGDFRFVFEDPYRNGEYRLYSPSADELSDGALPWVNDYEIKAKETIRKVPERYDYEAPGRQIEMPYLVTAFKGEGGKTNLYVNYGIPIQQYDPNKDLIDLTANTGTFLINDNRDILVERRRTLYGLATEQVVSFEDTKLWVDSQTLEALPGAHEVSVEFETAGGHTVAVQRRTIDIPNFESDRLALSDLLLAYRIEEAPDGKPMSKADIVRDGLSVLPAPWSVFSHMQPIYLYFEVYNLAKDADGRTDYQMEALLVPKTEERGVSKVVKGIFGGGRKGVSVSLPGSGTSSDDGQYLILDATNQDTGFYTLVLKVRDNIAKRDVETQQDLFLE